MGGPRSRVGWGEFFTRPNADDQHEPRFVGSREELDPTYGEPLMDRVLVLVRHGQSEWNLKNLFTGWKDVGLTEVGIAEARTAGRMLKAQGIGFDIGFTSALRRAQDTMTI